MPRSPSGVYTLPVAAFAPGGLITAAANNSNNSDIANALTESLATTGVSSMTGQLKLSAGSVAAPGLVFPGEFDTGLYLSGTGQFAAANNGVQSQTWNTDGSVTFPKAVTFGAAVTGILPPGVMLDWGGTAAPTGWLLCYGQAINRTTYATLFANIGTNYGTGDGSTTFNVPDCRGRARYGKDNMGGVTAGRITATLNFDGTVLGGSGGSQDVTLSITQIPAHTHANSLNDPGHTHSYTAPNQSTRQDGTQAFTVVPPGAATTGSSSTGVTITNASIGGGGAHANLGPAIIVNTIIYSGV